MKRNAGIWQRGKFPAIASTSLKSCPCEQHCQFVSLTKLIQENIYYHPFAKQLTWDLLWLDWKWPCMGRKKKRGGADLKGILAWKRSFPKEWQHPLGRQLSWGQNQALPARLRDQTEVYMYCQTVESPLSHGSSGCSWSPVSDPASLRAGILLGDWFPHSKWPFSMLEYKGILCPLLVRYDCLFVMAINNGKSAPVNKEWKVERKSGDWNGDECFQNRI